MSYTKQTWKAGDEVTSAKLNHMEDGINSVAGEVAELTETVENSSGGDENPFAWTEKFNEEDLEYPNFGCTCTEQYNSEPNEDGTYAFITFGNTIDFSKTLFVRYKYSNEEWINNETEREILTSDYTLTGIYIKSENAIVYGAKQIEDSEGNYSYTFDDNMPFMIKIIKFPRLAGNSCQVTFIWKGKYAQGFACTYINNNIKEIKPEFSNAIDNYYNSTLKNNIINTFNLKDVYNRSGINSKLTRTEILNKDNFYIGIYTGTLHVIPFYDDRVYSIMGTDDPYWENLYHFYPIQEISLYNFRYRDDLSYTFYMEGGGSKLIITKSAYNFPYLILNVRLELFRGTNYFSEYYEIQIHQAEQFNFSNSLIELLSSANFNKILCGKDYYPVTKIREYEIESSSYNFSSETIDGYSYTILTCNFPFSAISSFENIYVQINYLYNNPSMYKLSLGTAVPSRNSTYYNINFGSDANIILETNSNNSMCTLTIKVLSEHNYHFASDSVTSISLAQMDEASFNSIRKPFQNAIKLVLNQENITSSAPLMVHRKDNYTLDKTYAEVREAILAGKQVIIVENNNNSYSPVLQIQQATHEVFTRGTYYFASNENDYLVVPD